MPDEKRHTPKAYLVKKPSNHFTQRLTSENMLGDGTLFYFIVFVFFFHLKFTWEPIYLIKILLSLKFYLLEFGHGNTPGFPQFRSCRD